MKREGAPPLRITFICPPFDLSGGQRVVATYADRLHQRGHRVVVVAPSRRRPTARQVVRSLLRHHRWLTPSRSSHFDRVTVERRVLSRSRPITATDVPDADVVIATWWETAEWVMDLPPAKGTKVSFLQGYEAFNYIPVDRLDATWRFPMFKIVVARWLANLARDRFGDLSARVVPNAVDNVQFCAPPRSKGGTPTIGCVYTSHPCKGCDISLEAVRLAAKRVPELRLVAFGHAPVEPQLPVPTGTEYHVRLPQDRIRGIYSRCDGWLFGSRSEGFGLPILEAMACRTPVIGTPAGAAPELLAGGGGYLVRPEDPVDMAAAIVRLCRLPDADWRAMSDAAYATATRYTWDDATDLFEQALLTALGKVSPSGRMP